MARINITSGECLNEILTVRYPGESFIPFNEAMIRGSYAQPLFSDGFIRERSAVHGVSEAEYREKLAGFMDLLKHPGDYGEVILWFGDEPFCRANRKTVLEALQNRGYAGRITLHIVNEETGDILETREEVC